MAGFLYDEASAHKPSSEMTIRVGIPFNLRRLAMLPFMNPAIQLDSDELTYAKGWTANDYEGRFGSADTINPDIVEGRIQIFSTPWKVDELLRRIVLRNNWERTE